MPAATYLGLQLQKLYCHAVQQMFLWALQVNDHGLSGPLKRALSMYMQ